MPTHAESSNSPFGILTTLTTILMFVLYCFIFVLDGRNVLTLFERLHWKQLSTWKRVGLVFVYLCVFIIPALYLFFATQYFLRVRHQTLSGAIHNEWRRYRGKSPAERIGIALIISFLLLSFVGLTRVFANIDRENMLTSTQLTPTVAPILAPQATTTPTQSVAFQSPTDTPTAEPTSSETPVPTDTPTPIPTLQSTQSLAATHGTPQLGGPISDFIGAFGPPNDHSKPAASLGQYHFQRDANTTDVADGLIVLTSIDIENVVDNI